MGTHTFSVWLDALTVAKRIHANTGVIVGIVEVQE
jgi:hypothetical protein